MKKMIGKKMKLGKAAFVDAVQIETLVEHN